MRIVWVVYRMDMKSCGVFPYNIRNEAIQEAGRLQSLSSNVRGDTYFVQPLKEPMEDK